MADFLKRISKTGHEALQKENGTTVASKIYVLIQQCESEKERGFSRLGRVCYDMSTEEKSIDITKEPAASLFKLIKNCDDQIEQYRSEIVRIKNKKQCSNCGSEWSADSAFCAKCGSKLIQQDVSITSNRCCQCGTALSEDDLFCYNCGNKVTKKGVITNVL